MDSIGELVKDGINGRTFRDDRELADQLIVCYSLCASEHSSDSCSFVIASIRSFSKISLINNLRSLRNLVKGSNKLNTELNLQILTRWLWEI